VRISGRTLLLAAIAIRLANSTHNPARRQSRLRASALRPVAPGAMGFASGFCAVPPAWPRSPAIFLCLARA